MTEDINLLPVFNPAAPFDFISHSQAFKGRNFSWQNSIVTLHQNGNIFTASTEVFIALAKKIQTTDELAIRLGLPRNRVYSQANSAGNKTLYLGLPTYKEPGTAEDAPYVAPRDPAPIIVESSSKIPGVATPAFDRTQPVEFHYHKADIRNNAYAWHYSLVTLRQGEHLFKTSASDFLRLELPGWNFARIATHLNEPVASVERQSRLSQTYQAAIRVTYMVPPSLVKQARQSFTTQYTSSRPWGLTATMNPSDFGKTPHQRDMETREEGMRRLWNNPGQKTDADSLPQPPTRPVAAAVSVDPAMPLSASPILSARRDWPQFAQASIENFGALHADPQITAAAIPARHLWHYVNGTVPTGIRKETWHGIQKAIGGALDRITSRPRAQSSMPQLAKPVPGK